MAAQPPSMTSRPAFSPVRHPATLEIGQGGRAFLSAARARLSRLHETDEARWHRLWFFSKDLTNLRIPGRLLLVFLLRVKRKKPGSNERSRPRSSAGIPGSNSSSSSRPRTWRKKYRAGQSSADCSSLTEIWLTIGSGSVWNRDRSGSHKAFALSIGAETLIFEILCRTHRARCIAGSLCFQGITASIFFSPSSVQNGDGMQI